MTVDEAKKIFNISDLIEGKDLKKIYHSLARMYHPDLNPGNHGSEMKFKEINEAYQVLSDFQNRKQHDIKTDSHIKSASDSTGNNIINSIFKDDQERYIKERENYIKFLDEMEPKFNEYGRTLEKERERALNSKWSLFSIVNSFSDRKECIRQEVLKLQRRAKAFDEFLGYYLKSNQEIKTLYNRKLVNFDIYLDSKNRVLFDPEIFISKRRDIRNIIDKLEVERLKKIEQCKEEFRKRNLDFELYLSKRNINESTVSLSNLEKIFKTMNLMDQINISLVKFGMTVDDFLRLRNKLLIDVTYKELLDINDLVNRFMNNTKERDFLDKDAIKMKQDSGIGPMGKK